MATMQRALLRAGIELKYSEGFNPHPYMSIALPLPVGCGSVCELMDFEPAYGLLPDGLPDLISSALPEGIAVTQAYSPMRKFNGIAWLEIGGELHYGEGDLQCAADTLADRFSAESIVISKKTKRGESEIDIAPFIYNIEFSRNGKTIVMRAVVSAQNPTITPANLMSVLTAANAAPDFATFTRLEALDRDFSVFR
jgi:radical SAM-linked protein